jgi:hypothetical protein
MRRWEQLIYAEEIHTALGRVSPRDEAFEAA